LENFYLAQIWYLKKTQKTIPQYADIHRICPADFSDIFSAENPPPPKKKCRGKLEFSAETVFKNRFVSKQ
jgi:hypothetical protein